MLEGLKTAGWQVQLEHCQSRDCRNWSETDQTKRDYYPVYRTYVFLRLAESK